MTPNQITGLQAFARYMVDAALDGGDVDGGTIQEIAHQYGLLTKREMKGPCREPEEGYCACAFESGFPVECYQPTDALIANSAPAEPVSQGAVAKVSVWQIDPWYAEEPSQAGRNIGVVFLGDHAKILVDGQLLYTTPPSPDAELVKLMRDASVAMSSAHESLFKQCLSNGITNAWGNPVDVSKINDLQIAAKRIDAKLASL